MKRLTYAGSGVDIDAKGEAIRRLVSMLRYSRGRREMCLPAGHYTSLMDFGEVYLTLCTDGVGTKLLVADALGRWDTVGIDCIAMNVNDTVCVGAEPLAFVDYLSFERVDPDLAEDLGRGLNAGAEMANVDIVGGETAILPEIVKGCDMVGTCLGKVAKDKVLTGEAILPGDVLIGLASSGIHSNGLTLARRVVRERGLELTEETEFEGERFHVGEELLTPTRIYVREVLDLLREVEVHGIAHITGGGLRNLLRLRSNVRFVLTDLPAPPRVFRMVSEWGGVEPREMYQTFNMGVGMMLAVPESESEDILDHLGRRVECWRVGEVRSGTGVEIPDLGVRYERY